METKLKENKARIQEITDHERVLARRKGNNHPIFSKV